MCSTRMSSFRPFGIRALSKFHLDHPFEISVDGQRNSVDTSRRNPRPICLAATRIGAARVWFPMNFLLIESLQRVHYYYGDEFKVECPTGSGHQKDALECGRGTVAAPDAYFSAARWPASGVWRHRKYSRMILAGET